MTCKWDILPVGVQKSSETCRYYNLESIQYPSIDGIVLYCIVLYVLPVLNLSIDSIIIRELWRSYLQ